MELHLKKSSFICWFFTPPAHTEPRPCPHDFSKSPECLQRKAFPIICNAHILHYHPSPTLLMLAVHTLLGSDQHGPSWQWPLGKPVLRCAASFPSLLNTEMPNWRNHFAKYFIFLTKVKYKLCMTNIFEGRIQAALHLT